MADIAPFRAIRYDFNATGGDISSRIAPPYDVLDESDKSVLLSRSDRNVVAIDLPHAPAKVLGPADCYEKAGRTITSWLDDGTLLREESPAIYAYNQTFEHGGRSYTRRMFLARLKLEVFSAGSVLPHEETFGGPKEDRLALMKATQANTSPVFALYRDPGGTITTALAEPTDAQPHAIAEMGGVRQQLWVVTDAAVIDNVVTAVARMNVYIADGHHRYITALNFRDWVAQTEGSPLAPDHPANYIMVAFASMDDPGSLILPTHRVLVETGAMALSKLLSIWRDGCEKTDAGDADMTLYGGPGGESVNIRFINRDILTKLEPDKSAPWRALDVAYLHRYLIDELLTPALDADNVAMRYIKSQVDARKLADESTGIALICKPTTMAQLCAVSEAGDLMPQKSTYFYPKVATGLTINPLSD